MKYIPVMGLEIHAELLTNSKVYCSCANEFGGDENTRVCPVCSGMPGTLPVINRGAAELAVRAGFATDCTINKYSAFDRKNYFYPDLPKAYQITQFESPICSNGFIEVTGGKKIRIERIHIEEDAGKLVHDEEAGVSLADYNRCGVPLIEIVTQPDFRTVEEVQEFVEQIALRLKYAGVCDARMEQGSLRVDVNISVMPEGADLFGTRAEIKNLNSLRAIRRAVEYEIERQSRVLDSGGKVIQETRRFDDTTGVTSSLRSKEEAHDYRYFPEPDIPPILFTDEDLDKIKASMSEMPHKRFARYTEQYGLPKEDASLIIADKALSEFYDEAVKLYDNYKAVSNLILVELLRNINETGTEINSLRFTPAQLAETVKMSEEGIISKNAAKEILSIMFAKGGEPAEIAKNNGFIMDNDTSVIEMLVDAVLTENAELVQSYKDGNQKVFGFLMGQVMVKAGKGGNPKLAKEVLTSKLGQ